ncbi:hypothetical protein B0O99DRAFT_747708 [Bisporella sp. PMI_857]|nr:hypothetical protein B0O99DRAFT_747708 [Bisporella sp. PMI_857]
MSPWTPSQGPRDVSPISTAAESQVIDHWLLNLPASASNDPFISEWTSQPDNHGTINILWTSLFTVFLCSWTMLCLNLPAKTDGKLSIFTRKLRWMAYAIGGPEFVLGAAAGQYESAHRGVQGFKKLNHPDWTMRHAFFADMGGVILHPRNGTPFPVNNKHLIWLVENGYMAAPIINEREI